MPGEISRSYDPAGEYEPVPVSKAVEIAEQCDKAAVLIVSYDKRHGCMHYTTYGKEAIDKTSIANLSEQVSRYIGGGAEPLKRFEDFRFVEAAEYKERIDRAFNDLSRLIMDMKGQDGIKKLDLLIELRDIRDRLHGDQG